MPNTADKPGRTHVSDTPANHAQFTLHEARTKFEQYITDCIKFRTDRLGKAYGDQVKNFVAFLAEHTDWYSAPASTKYHLAVPGGLIIHSVGVCQTALALRKTLMPQIHLDSMIFVSLFHDVGKVWSSCSSEPGDLRPRYVENILKSTGRMSEAAPYKYNGADDNGVAVTIKDAMLPVRFVDLSDAEIQALMGADGQYVPINRGMQHKEAPLTLINHWADMWNGHVIEGSIDENYLSGILGILGVKK